MRQLRVMAGATVVTALVACGPGVRPEVEPAPDAAAVPSSDSGGTPATTYVYAHTKDALYRVDPDTLAIMQVGEFAWPDDEDGRDSMTDIAIDAAGMLIGISWTAVYRIDPATAVTTRLATGLTGQFNGLSFVPAQMLGQVGADVLVATRNDDGLVFRVDPATGATSQIGDMLSFSSSGDLVAVTDFGTVQTADNGTGNDRLIRLAPQTFVGTPIGFDIGFAEIWGIAYWKGRLFGFTDAGQFIVIDPASTSAPALVESNGPKWWGAAVTTSAPVIL